MTHSSKLQSHYRTHTCGQLNTQNIGQDIKLSGWIHSRRDHGGLVFIDLRDNYGLTQVVVEDDTDIQALAKLKLESVISIEGRVRIRPEGTINSNLSTGEIEVVINKSCWYLESEAHQIPFQINTDDGCNEETRLTYRFLDLRRQKMHQNILLRSQVISEVRRLMGESGFTEFQTPILTASSPEGARDFLVPSRLHKGKFYALPQAPQQFKQLLMISGFDRYFQIAPCFRDEDARADRSPGEFYQLDIEMSFVEQEDVFNTIEPIMRSLFTKFAGTRTINIAPFRRIKYDDAMEIYGSDKPDLRNPIKNTNVTKYFKDSGFSIFAKAIQGGAQVYAIPVPNGSSQSRKFFDDMIKYAQDNGAGGLAYIIYENDSAEGIKSPIAKFLDADRLMGIRQDAGINYGDAVCFVCDQRLKSQKLAGIVRAELGRRLNLIDKTVFEFCWIIDFPFYELNEDINQIEFSHNPFSMPQGGLKVLESQDPLTIKAYQYDIVCNGIELSSGAIRNHKPEIMYKAFEIAGYTPEQVDKQFGGMIRAFQYGAPPHGGIAPGIDRIVMLLAETDSIRDIIAFPLNGKAQDLLMNAPNEVNQKQLKELGIKLDIDLNK